MGRPGDRPPRLLFGLVVVNLVAQEATEGEMQQEELLRLDESCGGGKLDPEKKKGGANERAATERV